MMTQKPLSGYIIYPTYRIVDEEVDGRTSKKALVYLFGRLENGESFLVIRHYRPYFYIRKDETDPKEEKRRKKLEATLAAYKAHIEDTSFKNFSGDSMSKVILVIPGDVPKIRKELEEDLGIECYEADIRFFQRFLIDHEIKGTLKISGEHKKGKSVDRIYEEPHLEPSDWKPKIKILSIDIETDQKAKNIYCISLYTEGLDGGEDSFKKVLIVANEKDMGKPLKDAISLNTEKEMLEKFKELVLKIDPDIITGWSVIDFDLKVIKERFEHYSIPFTLGRIDWPCKLDIRNDFMRDSSADFPGRMVLDGIILLKISFIKLENYKLDTAAEEFLGEKKTIGTENKGEDIENYYHHDQQRLVDYNLKDSELVYNILNASGALPLTLQRSLITGMTLEKVKASVASLDSLFLREARREHLVLSSSKFSDKDEAAKGGFVMQSVPGIYDNVLVCDFKSLYPSIIITFNIDPCSYVPKDKHPKEMRKEDYVVAANGAVFRNNNGILPKILRQLWTQRDESKKRKDKLATYAIKIIMNSFYGVMGNPACRFFNLDISNAITYTGQEIIKLSKKKVEELGYKVIYGDTDSIFIVPGTEDISEAEKIGKKIAAHINDFYNEYIEEKYARKNNLEIQFEKLFKIFLMPTVRGSDEGAKKRYAGLLLVDGKEELHFTGMEFVRGDWTDLSKQFQLKLFDLVFHKEEVSAYVKDFVAKLRKGEFDDLLVYRKNINKSLKEYTKTTPPHVKAARQLDKLTSNQIQYVMTIEGPEPIEKLKHKPDYEHYIDKQLRPIADTILSLYGKSFDDILSKSTQTSLNGF